MTNQQHPITLPPELVEQWRDLPEFTDGRRKMIMVTLSREKLLDIATQAAQWGADQELEACCLWVAQESRAACRQLKAHRRPKPPSLKEQALKALLKIGRIDSALYSVIRDALESLPD